MLFDGAAAATADAQTIAAQPDAASHSGHAETMDQQTVAVLQALTTVESHVATTIDAAPAPPSAMLELTPDQPTSQGLNEAIAQTETLIREFIRQTDSSQLFGLFNGGRSAPDTQWLEAVAELKAAADNHQLNLSVDQRSTGELQGALGAFAAKGINAEPVIYLNADYANQASAGAIKAVLLEEMGHYLDARLNGNQDSPGDEGHAFASLLLYGDANLDAVVQESDQHQLLIDGQTISVEEAAP